MNHLRHATGRSSGKSSDPWGEGDFRVEQTHIGVTSQRPDTK